MKASDPRRIEELFDRALACSNADEVRALLDRECVDDAALRADVESLLAHHTGEDDILDRPGALFDGSMLDLGAVLESAGQDGSDPSIDDALPAGSRVDEYEIVRVLGAGGMGVVYEAVQERPSRTVALKVIRAGMTTRGMLRRFELEAELLGRLRHPGIAQVYRAGSGAVVRQESTLGAISVGRHVAPFIAMELIEGLAVGEHVRTRNLAVNERVELLIKIARAVEYAHSRSVIHRDLKPSNIIVDPTGQPKVLDFGIARATDREAGVTTMNAGPAGARTLIGTLGYMSPEQLDPSRGDIDTRSDVYALGAIAFELLTGSPAHDLANMSVPQAISAVRDREVARLSTINRALRGDLDTIVFKSMERDRDHRYPSAGEFAEDCERHLRGEPIAARRDSATYVIRKQLRRHRTLASAGALLLAFLIAFSVYAAVQSRRNARLAARLADELVVSTLEHGRANAAKGFRPAAEVLFAEWFKNPGEVRALGALRELHAQHPVTDLLPDFQNDTIRMRSNPRDRSLVRQTRDLRIQRIDAKMRRVLWTAKDLGAQVMDLQVVPDGSAVFVSLSDRRIVRLSMESGAIEGTIQTPESPLEFALAPNWDTDPRLFVAIKSGEIVLLRPDNRPPVSVAKWLGRVFGFIACHPTSEIIAFSYENMPLTIVDFNDSAAGYSAEAKGVTGWYGAFSPDGKHVISSGSDDMLRVVDVAERKLVRTYRPFETSIADFEFIRPGRIALGVWDGFHTVDYVNGRKFSDVQIGRQGTVHTAPAAETDRVVVSNGSFCAITGSSWLRTREFGGLEYSTLAIALSPDRSKVLSAPFNSKRVVLAHSADLEQVKSIDMPMVIISVVFSPDGSRAALSSQSRDLMIVAIPSLEQLARATLPATVQELHWSSDGSAIIGLQTRDPAIVVLDPQTLGERERRDLDIKAPRAMEVAPDGRRLVVFGDHPGAVEFSLPDLTPGAVMSPSEECSAGAFTPDGQRLYIGTRVGALAVADARSLRVAHRLGGHVGDVHAVIALPLRNELVTSGPDSQVIVRRLSDGAVISRFPECAALFGLLDPGPEFDLIGRNSRGRVLRFGMHELDRAIARNASYYARMLKARALGESSPSAASLEAAQSWARRVLGEPEYDLLADPAAK